MLDAYATRDRRINLRPVLDQAMAAAGLIDDRNGIIHLNAAATRLWDRDEAEVRGAVSTFCSPQTCVNSRRP